MGSYKMEKGRKDNETLKKKKRVWEKKCQSLDTPHFLVEQTNGERFQVLFMSTWAKTKAT